MHESFMTLSAIEHMFSLWRAAAHGESFVPRVGVGERSSRATTRRAKRAHAPGRASERGRATWRAAEHTARAPGGSP